MAFLTSLAAFIVALAILVVVHEFGHYLAARQCGVKVLRFSFGFGRVLWQRVGRHDGTEWAVSAFPLGGYVKMLDEREAPVPSSELPRAFNRQSLRARSWIVAAGPLANFVLAIALYAMLALGGIDDLRPRLDAPPAGTPAQAAGIAAGDEIVQVEGQPAQAWSEVRWAAMRAVLDARPLQLELRGSDGVHRPARLAIPAALAAAPDQDALGGLGLRLEPPHLPAVVGTVEPGSPAARAGVRTGDRIMDVDGQAVPAWHVFARYVRERPGQRIAMGIARAGDRQFIDIEVGRHDAAGAVFGRVGLGVSVPSDFVDPRRIVVRHGVLSALHHGVDQTWQTSILTLRFMWRMVLGEVSWRNISGPITIADYAGQTAQIGISAYVRFLALISVSLGVLNLLPIPVLDGGHLLYHFAEFIHGRALPERLIEVSQQVGMTLLGLLMMFAFYNDFNRLFSG